MQKIFFIVLICASKIIAHYSYDEWLLLSCVDRQRIIHGNNAQDNKKLMIEIIRNMVPVVVQANPFCFFKKSIAAILLIPFKERFDYYNLLQSEDIKKEIKALLCQYHGANMGIIEQVYAHIARYEQSASEIPIQLLFEKNNQEVLKYVASKCDSKIDYDVLPQDLQKRLVLYLLHIVNNNRGR